VGVVSVAEAGDEVEEEVADEVLVSSTNFFFRHEDS
jgi:hypothetical protein